MAQPRGHFEFGRVVGTSFDLFRRRWMRLLVLGLVFAGLPSLLEGWARHWLLLSGSMVVSWVSFGLTSLIPFMGLVLLTPAVAALLSTQAGGSVSRSLAALMRSAWGLLPYWLVNAAPALLVVGVLARSPTDFQSPVWASVSIFRFLLPVALALTVAVYAPVVMSERSGVLQSFKRTLRLMRAGRFQTTSFLVGVMLLSGTILIVIEKALAGPLLDEFESGIRLAIEGASQLCWSVLLVASYRELVRACDGPPRDEVAEIFA
jgi:hypothetical protein